MKLHTQPYLIYTNHTIQAYTLDIIIFSKAAKNSSTVWSDITMLRWVDGQGGLVCCSPRGCKESDTTEWLNWTELSILTATDPLWDFAHVFSLLFCFLNLEGHLKSYQSLHKALQGNWSTSRSFLSSLSTKCSVQSAFLKVEAGLSFTL